MDEGPYDARKLPNGMEIEFYRIECDLSDLSEVDRIFGSHDKYFHMWRLHDTKLCGQVGNGESLEHCMERLWKDVLQPEDFSNS